MADENTAPQTGAEGGAATAPEIQVTDQRSAADFFEKTGLLDNIIGDAQSGAREQNSGEEPEDGAEETPPTGEEEGQSEPQDSKPAAIEPPKSWSDEDKALFGKLPPEAQAVVAKRESERDKAFTQKTEEIANERKATQAEREAAQQRTAQYTQNLQAAYALAIPEAKQFENIDWDRLAREQPSVWAELAQKRESLRNRVGAIAAELQRVGQQQQQEQQQRYGEYLADQRQKLSERIPQFADPEKGKALSGKLGQFLQSHGYAPDEINGIADHRAVALAVKLMRYEDADTARKAAEAKNTARPAARIQQPGTPQERGEAVSRSVQNVIGQFRKDRDTKSAARLLEHLL